MFYFQYFIIIMKFFFINLSNFLLSFPDSFTLDLGKFLCSYPLSTLQLLD